MCPKCCWQCEKLRAQWLLWERLVLTMHELDHIPDGNSSPLCLLHSSSVGYFFILLVSHLGDDLVIAHMCSYLPDHEFLACRYGLIRTIHICGTREVYERYEYDHSCMSE